MVSSKKIPKNYLFLATYMKIPL